VQIAEAANHRHSRVVLISIQQLLAKREKGDVRQAIVFKNDRAVELLKDEFESGHDTRKAAHIRIRIVCDHLAWPIDRVEESPHCATIILVSGDVWSRSIGVHDKRFRLDFSEDV